MERLSIAKNLALGLALLSLFSCRLNDNKIRGHIGGDKGHSEDSVISFPTSSSSFLENQGSAQVRLAISPASSEDTLVHITISGSATPITDYTGILSGENTITIPKYSSSYSIPVTLIDNNLEGGTKSLILSLETATSLTSHKALKIGEVSIHELSILDDEVQLPPNNPLPVSANVVSTSQIDLTWLSGGGTTIGFRISYQAGSFPPNNCSEATQILDSAIVGSSHSVTGLSDNTLYSFRICSINGNLNPDISSGVTTSAKTLGLPPPDPSSPVSSPISDTLINLTWASGGGSTSDYLISYQPGATAPSDCTTGTVIDSSSISGTSFTIGSLAASTQYSFRICAINSNPTPDISSGVTLTASTPAPGLGTPSLYVTAPGIDQSYGTTANLVLLASISYVEMYITNTAGCGSGGTWEPYSTNKTGWTLAPDGSNVASVYAKFKTAGSVESSCVSDSILVPPPESINFCSSTTSTSTIAGYLYDDGGPTADYSTSKNCDFIIDYPGPLVLHFDSMDLLSLDTLKIWNDKKVDNHLLGNFSGSTAPGDILVSHGPVILNFYSSYYSVSSGFAMTWSPFAGSLPDSSILSINGGADYTTTADILLAITTSDPNLQQMYITNTPGCLSGGIWETKQASRAWSLTSAMGRQSANVKFRDAALHETPCEQTSIKVYPSPPLAALSGTPNPADSKFSVTVGDASISYYKFKFGPSSSTDCINSTGYSSVRAADKKISNDYSELANGDMKLCVVGGFETDLFQSYADATEFQWTKATPGVLSFKESGRSFTEGDQNITFTIVSDQLNPLPVTIQYDVFGPLVTELGLTGGQVVLPANASEIDIVIPVLSNPGADPDTTLTMGISEVTAPQSIGYQSQSTVLMKDAQRSTTGTVLDISDDGMCAIVAPGTIKCSGYTDGVFPEFTTVSPFNNFTKMVYNQSHRCALNNLNELYCWGWGFDGNLGQGTQNDLSTPTLVPGYTWKSVKAKEWNVVCGISTSDDLYCWGDQTYSNGAVGNGTTSDSRSPFQLDAGTKYKYVDTTGYFSCAVSISGDLKCWGKAPVGDGSTTDQYSPVAVDPGTSYDTVRIRGGSCGITSTGAIKCWGKRFWVDNATINTPELVPSAEAFKDLAFINSTFACGLTTANEVFCFGYDSQEYFNKGTYISVPFAIDPGVNYQSIESTDLGQICGLLFDGTVKCWSFGSAYPSPKFPWPVIADHQDKYSFIRGPCGVTLTGRAKCLGPPDSAKAESTILRDQFKTFGSSVKWKQISENCGIDFSDRLRCWYSNDFENYSYSSNRPNPVLQANGYTFKQISASGRFVCGILTDDSLVCLGQDNYGRKGDGSNSSINMSTPFVVDSGESYLDISVSNKAVCGVTLGNKLKCWGTHDYGNIGTGDSSSHFSPTWIDTSESYLSVETNSNYACGLTSAGAIKCWGRSMSEGGSFVEVSQPTTISAGGDAYLQISVTYNFGCGIRSDNRLLCWGLNSWNRLGTGNSTNSAVPVFSGDTGSYKKVFVDNSSLSCGITSTDTTKCWGGNLAGYSFSTPGIYPSPVFTTMSYGASPFYSRWLGLGSDGSLAWFYKPDRVPGIPSSTIYYEYVQSLVDK